MQIFIELKSSIICIDQCIIPQNMICLKKIVDLKVSVRIEIDWTAKLSTWVGIWIEQNTIWNKSTEKLLYQIQMHLFLLIISTQS